MPYADPEKHEAYNKAYLAALSPEKKREYGLTYQAAHKEEIQERLRVYRISHREEIREQKKTHHASHLAEDSVRMRTWYVDNTEKVMWSGAKRRAGKKGLPFNIEVSDIRIPEICPVLKIPIARGSGVGKTSYSSPSLDRIIPALGYVKGNIRVISHRANTLRLDATLEESRLIYEDNLRLASKQVT